MKKNSGSIVGGIIVLMIGSVMLLKQFAIFNNSFGQFQVYIVGAFLGVLLGVFLLITTENRFWSFVLIISGIVSGSLSLGYLVGYTNMDIWDFIVPIFVISGGLTLIYNSIFPKNRYKIPNTNYSSFTKQDRNQEYTQHSYSEFTSEQDSLNSLNINDAMSSGTYIIKSENFQGGVVRSKLGMTRINLLQANIVEKQITLDVYESLGSTEITVPGYYNVDTRNISKNMGDVNIRGYFAPTPDAPTIIFRGSVNMGNISIIAN